MLEIRFIKSVHRINDLPNEGIPELVLCGRSNVGKSSFINSLSKKKGIAKISSSPGKTRSINFYLVENKFFIVDLPGYGYAKVPKKSKIKWQNLISEYFNKSQNISLAYHFIDCRQLATDLDIILNQMLQEQEIPYSVILSKIDKLNQSEKYNSVKRISEQFEELILGDNLFFYSSSKKIGRKDIELILTKLFL
jgi:GTP-binding protein